MRGTDQKQYPMFSHIPPEKRALSDHALRPVRDLVDAVLKGMSPRFVRVYARVERPPFAPVSHAFSAFSGQTG